MELKQIRSLYNKKMKITFYLSEELYSNYRNLQKRTKTVGYKLDLSKDFSVWFVQQLDDANLSLQKIEKK